ncbi:MAG: glutathione S-transferase family protein [Burkholderiales bacterium]|jgi:glutathione S-transferase
MALTFYYGSGSPYAWRVWLALEHKAIAYELKTMSFSAGDLKKPEFAALNPRHKVPTIVDDGLVLYESAAILEYLEERYSSGKTLFPGNVAQRAVIRRLVREADQYLTHSMERLLDQVLFTKQDQWDLTEIAAGRADLAKEIDLFERYLRGDWFGDGLSAADFTIYPMLALSLRMEKKKPDLGLTAAMPPKIGAWMKRMRALPFHDKTYPPHWKANS